MGEFSFPFLYPGKFHAYFGRLWGTNSIVVRQVSFTLLMMGRDDGNHAQYERNGMVGHLA